MMENDTIKRLEQLEYSNPEELGRAEFKEHNSQFTEDFAQLLTSTYNLKSATEDIEALFSNRYWEDRTVFDDDSSMRRKAKKKAIENIFEDELNTISFLCKFYDAALDIKREVDPERALSVIGHKSENKGILQFRGLEEQISSFRDVGPDKVCQNVDGQEYTYQILSDSEIIYVTDRRN